MLGLDLARRQLLIDPVAEQRHVDVHSGHVILSAANTPRNNTGLIVVRRRSCDGTHQWGTSITTASILSGTATGTHEARVQTETVAEAGLAKGRLALVVGDDRQLDLLQDDLVLALLAEDVLAPAGGKAVGAVKLGVLRGQTGWLDVFGQVERLFENEQSNIVGQRALVELLVDDDLANTTVLVRVQFVLGLGVPFSSTDNEGLALLGGNAMGRGQDDVGGDQRTSALVHVQRRVHDLVFAQDSHHPGELAVLGLSCLVSGDAEAETIGVTLTTSVLVVWWWSLGRRWWWLNQHVTLFAASIQVVGALVLLGGVLTNANVNDARSVGDDFIVVAQVVRDALTVASLE